MLHFPFKLLANKNCISHTHIWAKLLLNDVCLFVLFWWSENKNILWIYIIYFCWGFRVTWAEKLDPGKQLHLINGGSVSVRQLHVLSGSSLVQPPRRTWKRADWTTWYTHEQQESKKDI
jgi:hypothetical protein